MHKLLRIPWGKKPSDHLSAGSVAAVRVPIRKASIGPGPQAMKMGAAPDQDGGIGQTVKRMPIAKTRDGMMSLSADTPEQSGRPPLSPHDTVKDAHAGKDTMPSLSESRDIIPIRAPKQLESDKDGEKRDKNGVVMGSASKGIDKAQSAPKHPVDRLMRISPIYYNTKLKAADLSEITMATDPAIGLRLTPADSMVTNGIKPDLKGEQIAKRDQPVYGEEDDDEEEDDMWVEAFKVGTHTDSDGNQHKWEPKHLDIIAQQYNSRVSDGNPEHKQAPVVLGHPKDDSPAYGWIDKVKVKGDRLMAHLDQLNKDFVAALKSGAYKFRSISLYPDLNIRHLGFLGGVQPAVAGLAPYKFADATQAITFEFAAPDEPNPADLKREVNFYKRLFSLFKIDVTSHSEPGPQDRVPLTREEPGPIQQKETDMAQQIVTGPVGPGEKTVQVVAQPAKPEADQGLLEKMKAGFAEAAGAYAAACSKGAFEEGEMKVMKKHFEEEKDEREKAFKEWEETAKAHKELTSKYADLEKKFGELSKAHAALSTSHAEAEATAAKAVADAAAAAEAAKKNANRQFCEARVSEGRMLPANVDQYVKFMEMCQSKDEGAANFAETKATPELDAYKSWLMAQPKVVEFGEQATTVTARSAADPIPGADASDKVTQFCEAYMKADPKVTWPQALNKCRDEHPAEMAAYLGVVLNQ